MKACTKPLLWDAKYDHNYTNALRPRRFKLCDIFYMILFSYTIGTFYLSSFFFPKSDYFNKLPLFVICDMRNFLKMCYLVKIGPSDLLSEHIDLFFFIDFFSSKQCLVENSQGKFQKTSSATFSPEESP